MDKITRDRHVRWNSRIEKKDYDEYKKTTKDISTVDDNVKNELTPLMTIWMVG